MNDNDRSILSITMLGHATVHAYELAFPIFIAIWMAEFGINAAVMGLVVSAGYALYGIGAVPSGVATDTYGSKRLISACLFGMGLSFLALSFARSVVGLTVALVCWGVAASVHHPAGLRLISTGMTERGTGFAYHGIAGNFGIAVGPLVAALLLTALDWQTVTAVLAVPALLAGVYTVFVSVDETAAVAANREPVTDGGGPSLSEFVSDTLVLFTGGFLVVFPMVVLEGFFYRGILTFLPEILASYRSLAPVTIAEQELDPAQYVYVALLVVGMAGQYVGGKLTDRMPPERAVVGVFIALAVLCLVFVPAANAGLVALLVVTMLLGFVLFAEQPLLQAVVADYSGSGVRGLSYGFMFLGVFGVGSLGATTTGAMLAYTTQQTLFLLLAIVPAVAAAIAAVLSVREYD